MVTIARNGIVWYRRVIHFTELSFSLLNKTGSISYVVLDSYRSQLVSRRISLSLFSHRQAIDASLIGVCENEWPVTKDPQEDRTGLLGPILNSECEYKSY